MFFKKENIILSGMFFSFFSINDFWFINPTYYFITILLCITWIKVSTEKKAHDFSVSLVMMASVFFVSQIFALYITHKSISLDTALNIKTFIIFVISVLYGCVISEFYDVKSINRYRIYKRLSKFIIVFFVIELLLRIYNGNLNNTWLYAFKSSQLYFDSNFASLVLLSFFMLYLFLFNLKVYQDRYTLIILFILILLTFSRAAIATSIISYVIFYNHRTFRKKALISFVLYLITFLTLCVAYIIFKDSFVSIDGSFNSKFYIVKEAINVLEKESLGSLIFGIGLGNFEDITGIFAHNIFVTFIVETGVVGTLTFSMFVIYTCIRTKLNSLYVLLPMVICGLSLFGSYSPYIFSILAIIVMETEINEHK